MGYKTINPKAGEATQFKKGQVASPNGRGGKFKALKDAYKDKLAQIDPDTGLTGAETLANVAYSKAKRGNAALIMEYANRTEGKPIQPVQLDVGIDDKTAQVLVELATTYHLLDPTPRS